MGKGDAQIVAVLGHLQQFIQIGKDHDSTCWIDGGRKLSKRDYEDVRDLLQLRWEPCKKALMLIAKKLGGLNLLAKGV